MSPCVCTLKSQRIYTLKGAGFLELPCRQGRNGELHCWDLRGVLHKALPNSWESKVSGRLTIYSRLALRRVEQTSQVSVFEEELRNGFKDI